MCQTGWRSGWWGRGNQTVGLVTISLAQHARFPGGGGGKTLCQPGRLPGSDFDDR